MSDQNFYDLHVLQGSVVCKNSPPKLRMNPENPIGGLCETDWQKIHTAVDFSDQILEKGLLFLGAAGQGKTNVMRKLADCILTKLSPQDVVVFFDVKGDYLKTFYQQGDRVLSPEKTNDIWNLFEDLQGVYGIELNNRVNEIVEYLYAGQISKEPFWTNAAKIITKCFILYLLYQALIQQDNSMLNHAALCELINGNCHNDNELENGYETYRKILNSNENFKYAGMFLPPAENGIAMGFGVITEILVMKARMFSGLFGSKVTSPQQRYLSPFSFAQNTAGNVLFLEYPPQYQEASSYVFRYFIDMLIMYRMEYGPKNNGKTYFFLDEIALLPNLKRLDQATALGRGLGIRVIAGLQEMEQLRKNYNENPHLADVVLNSFQNIVTFKCDHDSIQFVQKQMGTAVVQKKYLRAGGGVALGNPESVPAAEAYEFQSLSRGESIIVLDGENPFRFRFDRYD